MKRVLGAIIILVTVIVFAIWWGFRPDPINKLIKSDVTLPNEPSSLKGMAPICQDFFNELQPIPHRFSVRQLIIQNHNERLKNVSIIQDLLSCFSQQPLGKYVFYVDVFNSDFQEEHANDIFFQVSVIDYVTQNKIYEFALRYPLTDKKNEETPHASEKF